MRRFVCLAGVLVLALSAFSVASAETEQEIVNRYLKRLENKHQKKLSWFAVNYQMNRINRNNDYNSFSSSISSQTNADIPWLSQANTFGVDFGVAFHRKFAWTIGGEYWMKLGTSESGTYTYDPPLGTAVAVNDIKSEIKVYGVTTGLSYYLLNAPQPTEAITKPSLRVNGVVGYYHAGWDLWPEYENLNLSTGTTEASNATYEGNAPGVSLGLGADYPLNFFGLAFSADFSYLYLNFNNVAWYNSQDQEVIVTYDGTADGRVDLELSGFRGKVELKRYFSF